MDLVLSNSTRSLPQQTIHKQECIPVGCVTSARVAVCFRGVSTHSSPSRHPPGNRQRSRPPPVNRITNTCKNITFATLLRTVIMIRQIKFDQNMTGRASTYRNQVKVHSHRPKVEAKAKNFPHVCRIFFHFILLVFFLACY